METTLSRKWTESRTRGRKLHLTEAKARVGRARKTRADLERQLKACKREIANARERLIEATKQQTATSEMLRIISDSPLQSVLDAVAEHAARLCDNTAEIYRLENNLLRLVASYGELPVHIQAREGFPVNRDRVIGRTICDRRSVHVHDLAAEDSEYPLGSSDAKRLGHRTTLGIPLLRERTLIGGILFRRWEVRPFSDNQIALLESFADQAAIAIENVRLFEAEKQRTLALAQANRDLAEREAKIRCLVDANIIGIFIFDIEGRITEANDAFLHTVGYNREDLASGRLRWTDLTPAEWLDIDERERVPELKMTGILPPFEKEYLRKDGNRVPVLLGVAMFEGSGDEGVTFVLDISERKRAERALRDSEELKRRIIESSTDCIEVLDLDGNLLFMSSGGQQLLEIDNIQLYLNTSWIDFWQPEDRPKINEAVAAARAGGIGKFQAFCPSAKGAMRWWDVITTPICNADGQPERLLSVSRDITERKRAEAEARESDRRYREVQMELAHANRLATMGLLTASIAHEVNQPITGAITNAQAALRWLCARPPNLEEVQQALGRIVSNGLRAGNVVERIRSLITKAPPRKDRVDINEAIREVIELTRSDAVKNGVAVQADLTDGLPLIDGDRVQLQQVIINLVVNAVQAMSNASDGTRELSISSGRTPDGVLVTVKDSGPGLPPATLERLFEAFYTTKPGGLGLGLSICRSIIDAHGGRLWASANVPRGAIFHVAVPAYPDSAA